MLGRTNSKWSWGAGEGALPTKRLLDLEPPQIDLFWVVPERHHRPRSPQEGPFPGWVPVLNRKKTQMGLQGGLRKSGYFFNTDIDVEFEGKDRC